MAEVVTQHPEYHRWLSEDDLERDWTPDDGGTNPYLHMGMHITLAEQLHSDRPAGLRQLYGAIAERVQGDLHEVEHQMMECLGQTLWEAQRSGRAPDEQAFMTCLRRLARSMK